MNINPPNFSGEKLHLFGTIYKEDQKTPLKNCLVEIWQCDRNQVYDNTSDEYLYRGVQKTGVDGKYHFITTQPVAYPAAPNSDVYRPAHIHLRISGVGQQDLITQIYFKGDPNIDKDPCASSPLAVNRIITVTKNGLNERQVTFDIILRREFKPDKTVFEKISGIYAMNDNSFIEFYQDGDLLFMKWNGQIREGLRYNGGNEFIGGINNQKAKFEIQPDGVMKVTFHFMTVLKKEYNLEGIKAFKYE